MRTISASELKAKCLAILDEVAETGETVTVLKRGKPVARIVPPAAAGLYPQTALAGSVTVHGEIVAPALPAEEWEALAEPQ